MFTVPAGKYLLSLEVGQTEVGLPVEVGSGATVQPEVVLQATAGGTPAEKGLSWKIVSAQADIQGNRKEFGYSFDAEASFILPAGGYLVQVELDGRKAEQPVEVEAGKRGEVTIALP
ncbi:MULTISPECIES: hypothetical protein [unclassified Inquilinus]|uniref:hypothetical protein n=1 Tax=unclassified Inquilinus TaxID=2645927 RepID=UPI003F902369